jgi:hypothetical protein
MAETTQTTNASESFGMKGRTRWRPPIGLFICATRAVALLAECVAADHSVL